MMEMRVVMVMNLSHGKLHRFYKLGTTKKKLQAGRIPDRAFTQNVLKFGV